MDTRNKWHCPFKYITDTIVLELHVQNQHWVRTEAYNLEASKFTLFAQN